MSTPVEQGALQTGAGFRVDPKLAVVREKLRGSCTSSLCHPQRFVHVVVSICTRSSKNHQNVVNLRLRARDFCCCTCRITVLHLHGAELIGRILFPSDEYSTDSLSRWAHTTARRIDGSGAS